MKLRELLNAITAEAAKDINNQFTEDDLMESEVSTRVSHASGTYNVVTRIKSVEFISKFDPGKNKQVNSIVINSGYIS